MTNSELTTESEASGEQLLYLTSVGTHRELCLLALAWFLIMTVGAAITWGVAGAFFAAGLAGFITTCMQLAVDSRDKP